MIQGSVDSLKLLVLSVGSLCLCPFIFLMYLFLFIFVCIGSLLLCAGFL